MGALFAALLTLISAASAAAAAAAPDVSSSNLQQRAQSVFDCKHVKAKGFVFDLSRLPAPVTISNEESTPPTTTKTSIALNLCEALERESGSESEQCPPGTRVCMKVTNEKSGEPDRLTQVIGAGGAENDEWVWSAELGDRLEGAEKELVLEFHGSPYGSPYVRRTQRTEIDLRCDRDVSKTNAPEFVSYSKSDGKLRLKWHHPSACAESIPGAGHEDDDGRKDDSGTDPNKSTSSGGGFFSGLYSLLSWLFFLGFIAGIAYFAIGFWRNYNEYGVIEPPNKDFWREAPYIARDMGKHIYSTVAGNGSGRGAYEPV